MRDYIQVEKISDFGDFPCIIIIMDDFPCIIMVGIISVECRVFFAVRRQEKIFSSLHGFGAWVLKKNLPLVIFEDLFVVEGNQLLELIFQRKSAKKRF